MRRHIRRLRRPRGHQSIAGLGAIAAAIPSTHSLGQSAVPDNSIRFVRPWEGAPDGFRRVDEAVVDRDYLSSSLYDVGAEALLGLPREFDDLYLGPDGRYYRFDGALSLSFPRSEYQWFQLSRREYVELPVVPAGTIFHIGPPILGGVAFPSAPSPALDAPTAATGGPVTAIAADMDDLRASLRVEPAPIERGSAEPPAPIPAPEPPPTTLATNDAYRRMRIAALMESVRGREPIGPPPAPDLPKPAARAPTDPEG